MNYHYVQLHWTSVGILFLRVCSERICYQTWGSWSLGCPWSLSTGHHSYPHTVLINHREIKLFSFWRIRFYKTGWTLIILICFIQSNYKNINTPLTQYYMYKTNMFKIKLFHIQKCNHIEYENIIICLLVDQSYKC